MLTYLQKCLFFMLLDGLEAAEPVSIFPVCGAYEKFSIFMTWFSMYSESVSEDLQCSSNHRGPAKGLLVAKANTVSIPSDILQGIVIRTVQIKIRVSTSQEIRVSL